MNLSRIAFAVLLAAAAVSLQAADETEPPPVTVLRIALDNDRTTPYIILTTPNNATAVELPYAIEDWAGRAFTPDPSRIAGDFFISVRPGENVFFISPLTEGATRTLHIIMRGHDYPIELRPAPEKYAFRKVVFFDPVAEQAAITSAAAAARAKGHPTTKVQRVWSPPQQPLAAATPELQIGLIHFMQMLANLSPAQAAQAVAANKALTWAVRDDDATEAGDYRLKPIFAVRNNLMHALGVAVVIENTSKRVVSFMPDSFVLRSGEHVYPQTAADFNPRMAPGEKQTGFFVVARTPDDRPIDLAADTPMSPSLAIASTANPKPAAAVDVRDLVPAETSP